MRSSLSLFAACALLALNVACESNAVLEIHLRLPDTMMNGEPGSSHAFVAVYPKAKGYRNYLSSAKGFALNRLDEDGCNVVFSVEAQDARDHRDRLEDVALVVWFCPDAERCKLDQDSKWTFALEQGLWVGERTRFEASYDESCSDWGIPEVALPAAQDTVWSANYSRCFVLGCSDEDSAPATSDPLDHGNDGFCVSDRHPCD